MEHNRIIYEKPYDSEVEYLRSNNSYIDSGIYANQNTKIEMRFCANSFSTASGGIIGVHISKSGHRSFAVLLSRIGTSGHYTGAIAYDDFINKGISTNIYLNEVGVYHTLVYRNGLLKLDNEEEYTNFPDHETLDTMFIMRVNGSSFSSQISVSYCKIWNGDTLVRDFIPVRKGLVGFMYDKVSGKLFANKGTGNFILGNDVNNPVPKIRRVIKPCRLEEGVDYQRYDWLKGDGTAYMTDTTENSFSSDLYNLDFGDIKIFDSTQTVGLFYNWVASGSKYAYLKYINSSMRFAWHITNQGYNIGVTLENGNLLIKPNIINDSRVNGICINNNKSYKIGNTRYLSIGTVGSGAQISAPAGIGITQFVQSYVSDGTIRRELKPCKLLRSIPASLDANGIARHTGECGMIDLISGKFYGNVANTGTFTVENDN